MPSGTCCRAKSVRKSPILGQCDNADERVSFHENMRNRCWRDRWPFAGPTCHAGERVSVITRGAHLASIVETGLCLIEERQEIVARVAASDRIADVGEQDLIIPGMNAHQVVAESGYFLRDQAGDRRHQGAVSRKGANIPGAELESNVMGMRKRGTFLIWTPARCAGSPCALYSS
jgi:hypothetical protein